MSALASMTAPSGPALHDIHLPPAPSWWPPAPGWWVLALLVATLAIAAWRHWRRRQRRHAQLQALLTELDELVDRWRDQPARLAASVHQLLRRCALRFDAGAGQRQGSDWRRTLAQVPVEPTTLETLMALEAAMYRSDATLDVEASMAASRRWLTLAWRVVPQRGPVQQRADRVAKVASDA